MCAQYKSQVREECRLGNWCDPAWRGVSFLTHSDLSEERQDDPQGHDIHFPQE